jgi:hypothetical protein
MIRLHAYPVPPPSVSKLSLLLSLPVYRRFSLLTNGRGWRAWSRIILSQETWASVNRSQANLGRVKAIVNRDPDPHGYGSALE